MQGTEVRILENSAILVSKLYIADNFCSRLRGLLGTSDFVCGMGLLIVPCSSVHTFGMKYPIDVIFLNRHYKVLKIVDSLKTMRMTYCPGSDMVLELPAGTAEKACAEIGQRLVIR